MIHPERICDLNTKPLIKGKYLLYWMQASQRASCNHALEWAIRLANDRRQPLVVAFGLMDDYPDACQRHYAFMLQGLCQTSAALKLRGIKMVLRRGHPAKIALELADSATLVVADRGYTRHQKAWRHKVAHCAPCPVVQIETDVVVPVETASDKQEYAAATLRPKLHRQWNRFLVPLEPTALSRDSLGIKLTGDALDDPDHLLSLLNVSRDVPPVTTFTGGVTEANDLLDTFIRDKLPLYAGPRNDPSLDIQSHQSPYLHFGQVSPLQIALRVQAARDIPQVAADAYLEQILVRRELAINFVHYCKNYDAYHALPAWAQTTLSDHRYDRRPSLYTIAQLEHAQTADPYWNAAMQEMRLTGKMHNYMRMYWGKKVIEWSTSPHEAFASLLYLNNKYFLDGRDPAGWTNIAWCFGLHDRPWKERPVFGKVRYMNATGLERKFDIDTYVQQINTIPR